ncbi:hypothetical protein KI688_006958 [Linnemannia hyalina]|uniref:Uncharacterized protein n=1 Tax=Linnemannia hyalina TaxID=64524 RepID=A0A9P7XJK7_9FUNG|nr:hypothetical protein KI688_006958 [Linnemannia hyalina]
MVDSGIQDNSGTVDGQVLETNDMKTNVEINIRGKYKFEGRSIMNPETIRMIGSFIPIWTREYNKKDKRYEDKFQPAGLIDLFLVCKLWHYALVPILWECYDYHLMAGVPMSQLKANVHHIRYISLLGREHRKNEKMWEALEGIRGKNIDRLELHDPTYPVMRLLPPIREAHDPEAIGAFTPRPPPPPRIEPVIPSSRAARRIAAANPAPTTQTARPADIEGALLQARARAMAHGRADNQDLTLKVLLSLLPPMQESEFSQPSSSTAPTTTTPVVQHQPAGAVRLPARPAQVSRNRSGNVVITSSHPYPAPEPAPPLFRVCVNLTEFWVCGVMDKVHLTLRSFIERQEQLRTLEIERYMVTTLHWVQILKDKPDLRRLVLRHQTMLPGFDGEHLLTLPITRLEVRTDRIDLNAYKTMLRDCPELIHLSVLRPQVFNIVAIENRTNKGKKGKGKKCTNNPHNEGIFRVAAKGTEKCKDVDKDDGREDEEDEDEKEKDINIINAEGFAVLLKQHGKNLKSFEVSSNMPRWTSILIASLPKSLETLVVHSNQLENRMVKAIISRRSNLTTLVLDLGSGLSRKGRLNGVRRVVRDCHALQHLEVHDHNDDNLLRRLLFRRSWETFNIETVAFHGVRGRERPIMMQVMPPAVSDAGWNKVFIGKKYQCCDTRDQDAPRPTRRRRNGEDVEPEPVEEAVVAPPVQAPGQSPHRPTKPRYPLVDLRTLERLQQFPRLHEVIITDTRYRRVVESS